MSAISVGGEMIYTAVDRITDAWYLEDSLVPLVALIAVLGTLTLFALSRRSKGHAEKHPRQRSDRFDMRALVIMTAAAVVTVYTTLNIGRTSSSRPRIDVFSGKDRPTGIPDLYNATIRELQHGLESKQYTSVDLVDAYLARINEVNSLLHAVIETAPIDVLYAEARRFDTERASKGYRGYLHGIPILVKDNVATDVSLGMNTTAGSFALLNSVPPADSIIVASLRKAGAIILGKTNMSVWAQARGNTTQGWSPRGGYTYSAFYPHGNACSSSSGAGVATSIGLAAASIGSETDGSIICPGTRNSLVGFKPTVGFASRFGIIPISSTQDTAGPMTRSVEDAAIILTSMFTPKSGFQAKLDSAIRKQPRKITRGIDYAQRLLDLHLEDKGYPLAGVRIGVTRGVMVDPEQNGFDEEVVEIYEKALKQLQQAGATLVNVTFECSAQEVSDDRDTVLSAEFYESMRLYMSYLKHIPTGIFNIGGIYDFNNKHPELELPKGDEDQSFLVKTLYSPMYAPTKVGQKGQSQLNDTYIEALKRQSQTHEDIRRIIKDNNVIAIVGPSDSILHSLAAKAGSPSITIPAGFLRSDGVRPFMGTRPIWPFNGAPVGLNFISTRWQEEALLKLARGYEVWQIRNSQGGHDGKVRTYKEATPTTQLRHILTKTL